MSLFGALFSGVSGLTAQSSAMGAVSDNITNVSTIGYKNTDVNFQTLVTKQVSATFYSAGGVQSKPRQRTEVQGLLQASTSSTDIAISGQGFFVVNEASRPTNTDQFLYTRAGSFIQDNEGFLKNTSGYYLQAWPTDASGNVIAVDTDANPIPNQNIISTDFLETVNLSRVGGTAAATSNISIGANLPANATVYDSSVTPKTDQDGYQKTDVQFFDSLGNANTVSFEYLKSARANKWDLNVEPPSGTSVLTLYDGSSTQEVYDSQGLLEFTDLPADGSTVTIDGTTYEFDTDSVSTITAGNTRVDVSSKSTLAEYVSQLFTTIKATDSDYTSTNERVKISDNSTTTLVFHEDGTGNIVVNPVGLLDSSGSPVTNQTSQFTVQKQDSDYSDYKQFKFPSVPVDGDTVVINGITYEFDSNSSVSGSNTSVDISAGTIAATVDNLAAAIASADPQFTTGSVYSRDAGASGSNNTLVLSSLPSGSFNVTFTYATPGNVPTEPDGTASYTSGTAYAVDTGYAINFDSDGLPLDPGAFNVTQMEVKGFTSGAADMDDDASHADRIDLDFGTVGEADGMTQFGAAFTPVFIQQNGSRFGTFAGLTVDTDGLMTALFDNGETRIIYKIPIATFVNPNSLESHTGNIWNATEASGDYTLRVADSGPAGQVTQGALEASTVDIGEEFTKMIVVQRAYSAATKIIRTADEMLDELTRIK